MKRLIPRDGAEWVWLACIVIELAVTVAHATAGDWFAALNSALWAGMIFTLAASTRAWKTARRDADRWRVRARRAEDDLRSAGIHIACRLPDGAPVIHRFKEHP